MKSKNKMTHRHRSKKTKVRSRAFLLLLVLLVVPLITLSALALAERMFLRHEEVYYAGNALQARLAAESGIDSARLFLARDKVTRKELGGVWNNPTFFQAFNVVTSQDPNKVCNYSIIAPNLDESGSYTGIRYGLQNESAKLNLNALVVIDQQYKGLQGLQQAAQSLGASLPTGGGGQGTGTGSGTGSGTGNPTGGGTGAAAEPSVGVGRQLLMGLPGMTENVADAILDFLDQDDTPARIRSGVGVLQSSATRLCCNKWSSAIGGRTPIGSRCNSETSFWE